MNINDVFIARIYIKYDEYVRYKGNSSEPEIYPKSKYYKLSFVEKKTTKDGRIKYFEDIFGGNKYMHIRAEDCKKGELYVELERGLIPVTTLIETKIDNPEMSKKRIRRIIDDNFNGNN